MVALFFLKFCKNTLFVRIDKKNSKKIADILRNTCYFVVFYIFKTFF